jgi:hypothetical protein
LRTYLTFGDIEGKLDVLLVECTRCQRKGRHHVAKLIEKYGRRGSNRSSPQFLALPVSAAAVAAASHDVLGCVDHSLMPEPKSVC